MNRRRTLACLAALALALVANLGRAAGLSPDPTGLWFDPAQPGWGIEVAQQGETAFAVLFTYDASHKPTWYVASNLFSGIDFNEVPPIMQGTLYRTTGPAFSASSFDPHAVGVSAVGDLQLTYSLGASQRQLAVTYSIDGAQFSRNLRAQTWSSSAQDLIGDYGGQIFLSLVNGGSTPSACPSADRVTSPPVQPSQPYTFSVVANGAPDRVRVLWGTGIDIGCAIDATYARDGQLASLSGGLACGPIGNPLPSPGNPVVVSNIVSSASGFAGSASLELSLPGGGVCTYLGSSGGVLRQSAPRSGMTPDPTGLWYAPAESGWGLLLTQQGGNVFAALFAYGVDNKPAWWVASNVVDSGAFPGLGELFSGTLYRTTGPYFGAADTTSLSATSVGTLQIRYPPGTDLLSLSYTIDGTTVEKTLHRQTWSSNASWLAGQITGGLFPSSSACGTNGIFAPTPTTFNATWDYALGTVQLLWGTGSDTACVLDARYVQTGQLASIAGPVRCGPLGNPIATLGTVTISAASVGSSGFAGFANFDSGSCTTGGFVGGVRH